MKNHVIKTTALILFLNIWLNVQSQQTNISSFAVLSNYKSSFKANLSDTSGKYGSNEFSIGFNIPVYTHLFKNKEGKAGFSNLDLQNNNSIIVPNIEFLNKSNTLLNLNLGIRGVYFTGNKNLWLSKLSLNFFEDEYSISSPHPRFTGVFLFYRIVNRNFSYHLGFANRYSFGIASVLPVAGLKYSFSDHWKLFLTFPFNGSIQYKANKKLLVTAKIHPSGAISYYTMQSTLFGQLNGNLLFRKKATAFSIDGLYKLNEVVAVKASIGREVNQKIFFSDVKTDINKEPNNYFVSGISPSWFINIGFTFKLGKNPKLSALDNESIDNLDENFEF
ncbi:MAG: DUF6268 family outer membrane beta-barrel protein [Bacteroidales bacterium]